MSGDFSIPTLIESSLLDGTQLTAMAQESLFTLEVYGISESIAEIGEQFAWLTSALRSFSSQMELGFVNALVSKIWTISSEDMAGGSNFKFGCHIDFEITAIATNNIVNGQCWHRLFRNPVVVRGYPIPKRPKYHLGLEMSLDTMAALAGTCRLNTLNNKLFIKGFSAMLTPTGHSDNIIFWHLDSNKDGDRISYLDSTAPHVEGIDFFNLTTSRHILGWSSEIRYLVGKDFLFEIVTY